MCEQLAVVVIPVYKVKLNEFEKVSLAQVRHVLRDWPTVFLAPESLNFDFGNLGEGVQVERFPKKFFASRECYSELLLQPVFYERFINYEYMLIYQLDAFVFSDRLKEFCELGYDYVGAPCYNEEWQTLHICVGNGGFSLRRTSKCIDVIKKSYALDFKIPRGFVLRQFEDLFFGFYASKKEADFHVPAADLAANFCIQESWKYYWKIWKEGWRPFGIHYWPRQDYDLWYRCISALGYELPSPVQNRCPHVMRENMLRYNMQFLSDSVISEQITKDCLFKILNIKSGYALWGYGYYGQCFVKWLTGAEITIEHIYDQNDTLTRLDNGNKVERPEKNVILDRNDFIIVAMMEDASALENLRDWGLAEGRDYIRFDEILYEITQRLFSTYSI